MSTDPSEQKELLQGKSRWLRAGFFTFTVLGPMVGNLLTRLRQQQEAAKSQSQELSDKAQVIQDNIAQRLDQVAHLGRQRTVDQIQTLQTQSHDLQKQIRHLRKALRKEMKQRTKLAKRLRKMGRNWNEELLKRGEDLRDDLLERSGQLTHDLTAQGSKFTQTIVERSGQLTHDLTERGEHLLQPLQRRKSSRLATFAGFGAGLVGAGVITYLLIRRKTAQLQAPEIDQQIELPQSDYLNGGGFKHPAGEVMQLERESGPVAIMSIAEVEKADQQIPAQAAFVGRVSTKYYYPLGTELDDEDVVYFMSEAEAKAQGYSPEA